MLKNALVAIAAAATLGATALASTQASVSVSKLLESGESVVIRMAVARIGGAADVDGRESGEIQSRSSEVSE